MNRCTQEVGQCQLAFQALNEVEEKMRRCVCGGGRGLLETRDTADVSAKMVEQFSTWVQTLKP